MKEALIIFIKNPVKGKVKTRLARSMGDDKALAVYHQLLAYTRKITEKLPQDKFLFYSDDIDPQDQWDSNIFRKMLQLQEGNLGAKMQDSFEAVFKQQYDKAVIIGSDCLELTEGLLSEAFIQLANNDVVIGPATDGGYYLLGMKKMHKELFTISNWSTRSVFSNTMSTIAGLQLSCHALPELSDIDTEEDLNRFNNKLKSK